MLSLRVAFLCGPLLIGRALAQDDLSVSHPPPAGGALEYKIHADASLDPDVDEDAPAAAPPLAGEPRPAVTGNGLIEDSSVKDENGVFRVANVTNLTSETAIRAKLGPELKKLSLRYGDLRATGSFATAASTSLKDMDPVAKGRIMRKIARSFIEEKGAAVLGTNSEVEWRVVQTVVDTPGAGSAVEYQRSVRGIPCPDCGVTMGIDGEGRVRDFSGMVMSLDEILSRLGQKLIDDKAAQERVRAALADGHRSLHVPRDAQDDAAIGRASILICANAQPYVMRVVSTPAGTFYLDAVTGEIRGGP